MGKAYSDPFEALEKELPFGPEHYRVQVLADAAFDELADRLDWWSRPENNATAAELAHKVSFFKLWSDPSAARVGKWKVFAYAMGYLCLLGIVGLASLAAVHFFWPGGLSGQSFRHFMDWCRNHRWTFRLGSWALLAVVGGGGYVAAKALSRSNIPQSLKCRKCGYNCKGLSVDVVRKFSRRYTLGPLRCPECGAKWPIIPPKIPTFQ